MTAPVREHGRRGRRVLTVSEGEIFGILGPNGAGKLRVLGLDPLRRSTAAC
jgi:ABC-type hemin transport system ATPase subunit